MASGDVLEARKGATVVKLLDAVAAASDGVWIDTVEFRDGNLHFVPTGTVSFTAQVCGSSAAAKPANNTHGFQVGSDLVFASTTELGLDIVNLPRFLKVRISTYATGTLSALGNFRRAA